MAQTTDPFQTPDDDARDLARNLIGTARFAALGVLDPTSALPVVSRVAVAPRPNGGLMALVSDLSHHTQALVQTPTCSVMVGEPGNKGDPLTYPRLTLQADATFHRHGSQHHPELANLFTQHQPKTKLYIGFGDFSIVTFEVEKAFLNGGFGKAYHLSAQDLLPRTTAPDQ